MKKYILIVCLHLNLVFVNGLLGQEAPSVTAAYTTENIKLDGLMEEEAWQKAESAGSFWQFFPKDSIKAEYSTEVKIVYNDDMLYLGVKAAVPHTDFVVSSLKRDFRGSRNDNVTLLFDTFSDGTNAYAFGVTPYGVRREILVSAGGASREGYNSTWDVKWQAESKIYEDYYIVEMAIPFTSIKFAEGSDTWRFRPYRWNLQTNEQSTWVRVPQSQLLGNLAFMGELKFEKPLGKSRTPFAVIPYINGFRQTDFEANKTDNRLTVGGDAKISIGDGMNLDLTINPDFSNVEVDDVITNLTRFEVILPEKRQFFIDNSDLFDSFGHIFNEASPFFSRRIGLARDTAGNLIQNNIRAGLRLSGKLNKDWRLGFLNIQTAEDLENQIGSNNNMMFALQRKIANRSNLGIFMVNRQTFGDYDFLDENDRFNRVIGADYNLATEDSKWTGRFYVHKSLQPDDTQGNLSAQANVNYNANNLIVISDLSYIDKDFDADLGFVPRKDVFKFGNSIQRFFFPKNRIRLNRHSARAIFINYWKPTANLDRTDHFFTARWQADFKNRSNFRIGYINRFIFLTDDFDPTRTEGAIPVPGNLAYNFSQFSSSYESGQTNLLTFELNTTIGGFFNGNRYSFGGEIAYRVQPWVQLSLAANYDGIRLPDPYPSADIILLTPRINVTFSKSLFWSTLIQYGSQADNFGINSRLQWRFAPLSDLFLVYNDNYYVQDFNARFRSINLKVSYWLNL